MGQCSSEENITRTKDRQDYILGKVLGRGNYSEVRQATCKETNEQVAVKCITKAKLTQDDESALQEEVTILQAINHRNIINLVDFYEDELTFYIVMEIAVGGELFDKIVENEFYSEADAQSVRFLTIIYYHRAPLILFCLRVTGCEDIG